MSQVTPTQTEALARLARLSLSEPEREKFSGQLASIITYIDTLRDLDVSEVAEYRGAGPERVELREDRVGPMLTAAEALAPVPSSRDDQVLVPKFKED